MIGRVVGWFLPKFLTVSKSQIDSLSDILEEARLVNCRRALLDAVKDLDAEVRKEGIRISATKTPDGKRGWWLIVAAQNGGYGLRAIVRVDEDGVRFAHALGSARMVDVLERLEELYDKRRLSLYGADVSSRVARALVRNGAVSLSKTGGSYFVPRGSKAERIADAWTEWVRCVGGTAVVFGVAGSSEEAHVVATLFVRSLEEFIEGVWRKIERVRKSQSESRALIKEVAAVMEHIAIYQALVELAEDKVRELEGALRQILDVLSGSDEGEYGCSSRTHDTVRSQGGEEGEAVAEDR